MFFEDMGKDIGTKIQRSWIFLFVQLVIFGNGY